MVARVDGRLAHFVVGLRGVTDEPHFLRPGEECALGLLDDESGLAVCTDALRDAELGPMLLATVRQVAPRPGPVGVLRDDDDAVVLDCDDRGDLMVFPWLDDRPRASVDLLVALDAAGFNHVAAPSCAGTRKGATWDWSKSRWPTARLAGRWPSPRCVTSMLRAGPRRRPEATSAPRPGSSAP